MQSISESRARYSCDACRSRKVACSRNLSGCQRCKTESVVCSYSRSGVIRRNRKKNKRPTSEMVEAEVSEPPPPRSSDPSDASTHTRLQRLVGKDHRSLSVIASLLEEHAAAWQDSSAFDALADGAESDYFRFEDGQLRSWFEVFITTLQKERLTLPPSQSDLLEHVLASHPPRLVHDRAWLVMFYSITLGSNTSDALTTKLSSNLWHTFNDVRLLLEPKIPVIQALIILACHAEKFMTPSICWMLISKACMMFQAIDTTHIRLDAATRDMRNMLFWRLNTLDKSLALILCRRPIFAPEMATGTPLPPLEQLLLSPPTYSNGDVPTLFNAHYIHQMHLMSNVMADVWNCLYGRDSHKVREVTEDLEKWYRQATEVLEAAALAEKPLLRANVAILVDFGLETLHYHYYYLSVLIRVSNRQLRAQSTSPSMQLLRLLPSLGEKVTNIRQPYCCLLWQQLHCPLAAFGSLWGEIVIKRDSESLQTQQFLEAIECLPPYLQKLGSRNSLAIKLAGIVEKIVQNSRLIHSTQGDNQTVRPENTISSVRDQPPSGTDGSNKQNNTMSIGAAIETSDTLGNDQDAHFQLDSIFLSDDGFLNTTLDWFTWPNEELSDLSEQVS